MSLWDHHRIAVITATNFGENMSTPSRELRSVKRHITTNDKGGRSIFAAAWPEAPIVTLPDGLKITFCYGTNKIPVPLPYDQDLYSYEHMIQYPPGIAIPGGTALRIVDFPPGYQSSMHRTVSVDYCVIIKGRMELILNSGETRSLCKGDSAIQRYVEHAWRNASDTEWARIVAVPLPAEPMKFSDSEGKARNADVYTKSLGPSSA